MLRRTAYTSHHMMHITDWLPTLMHAVTNTSDELSLPTNLDGLDQWDALSNNLSKSRRNEILHNIDPEANTSALRVGDMKLVFASHGSTRFFDRWYPTPEARRDPDGTLLEGTQLEGPYTPYDLSLEGYGNIQQMRTSAELNLIDREVLLPGPEYDANAVVRPAYMNELAHPQHSKVTSLLEKIGRKPLYAREPLIVKCGARPANATSNCKPWLAACLFNITADPCEYENLATSRPHVVNAMQRRLQFYREHAVTPLNKPVDDAGLPYRHNWTWVPWR